MPDPPHHPRSQGGRACPTKLTNLIQLCTFHHQILVHQRGWTITPHSDGTTTITNRGRTRQYHSHSPPNLAA
jgi:hypothetical protein